MLSPLLLAALVELFKTLFETYLPNIPITAELINSVLVIVLSWFGLEVVKIGVATYAPKSKLNAHFR